MATITSKCPHCGGQIVFETKSKVALCNYCDSIIAIKSINSANNSENYFTKRITPELQYMANFMPSSSFNSKGGLLFINSNEIVFRPHKLNLGSLDESYCELSNICGYKKGILTYLTIYAKDDNSIKEITYAVWEKNIIINNIEYYRQKFYKDKGADIPALTLGNEQPMPASIQPQNFWMEKITNIIGKTL